MMPEDGIEQLSKFDAIYLGAAGFPTVPDHVSLWGLLIPIRREFDQHINLRPVRLFEGLAVCSTKELTKNSSRRKRSSRDAEQTVS